MMGERKKDIDKKKKDEQHRLNGLSELWIDPHPDKTGVLLADEIKFYVDEVRMICPWDCKNLKPAGYELTIGDEAMLGGEHIPLRGASSELRIPPFEVAVIKTAETINLPRFLIARWNIRVKWAYKGLLWVGGPQVDPGYVGHLFCPLYNLSNELVKLQKGEPIALMDFVKTSGADQKNLEKLALKKYPRPPSRVIMEDYAVHEFRSALFAQDRQVKEGIETLKTRVDVFSTLTFVVLAILFAAIGLPLLSNEESRLDWPFWESLVVGFSFFAFLLSIFAWWPASRTGYKIISVPFGWKMLLPRRWWQLPLALSLAGALTVCLW